MNALKFDFSQYSAIQLEEIRAGIDEMIQERREQEQEEAFRKIAEIAAQAGISKEQLIQRVQVRGRVATPSSGREKLVKYRHPQDPGKTWSGRGRRPFWLDQLLSEGKTMDDLLA